MVTDTIELKRTWRLGSQLAQGGFGQVHIAEADDGSEAVIKLVPKTPGASRELLFEPLSGVPNVIPILDAGEWRDYYVLVMPRAEKSLRDYLQAAAGKLDTDEAVKVLIDVAEGLSALQKEVVHRDLKPENVLLYQDRWCLADFGIARYAEATTAPDTHKFSFTRQYASPEQWRHERATAATDVYAFGVIAFELLQGDRPFQGPDFRDQHLNQPSPALTGCIPALASLVTECLYKAPQARPTPHNILARLRASQKTPSAATAKLQAVNQSVVDKEASEEAQASAHKSIGQQRAELLAAARHSLQGILDQLIARVLEAAPSASTTRAQEQIVRLGTGVLVVNSVKPAPSKCLAAFTDTPAFDVIAYTAIAVRKPWDRYDYEGRSHSLWFCDAYNEGVYRWYETAFMVMPLISERYTLDPFSLPPTDKEAGLAFSSVMASRQIAWQPLPFDQGDEDPFIERWKGWFAEAAGGTLHHPSQMPENSGGHYRRLGSH